MRSKLIILPTSGYSMYPFFLPEDVLYIRSVGLKSLKVDDFVTFRQKDIFITHRLIYKDPSDKYLITKGDKNLKSDGKIKTEKIIGRVVKVKRGGKLFLPENIYAIQSGFYYREILRINTLLRKNKVNFLYLKGLPLYLHYEKRIPRRLYSDCDILIGRTQLDLVKKIMAKAGYEEQQKHYSLFHKILKNKETEIDFIKRFREFDVDFDIHLEPSFMMHQIGSMNALYPDKLLEELSEKMLEEKREIIINGHQFDIPKTIHLIVYLALHIFHHNLTGYSRFYLLDLIIRKSKFSEREMIDFIKRFRLEKFTFYVFFSLSKLYRNNVALNLARGLGRVKSGYKVNIFDDQSRVAEGVKRFKMIFVFSPNNYFRKLMIFLNVSVVYSIVWVLSRRIRKLI